MDAYKNFAEYTELSSIGIARGSVARIENRRGSLLRVETGSVWVTQQKSTGDVFLHAGKSFRIERDGVTLVSTCNGARFALVTIEPAIAVTRTLGERFWDFWAGLYAPESRPTAAAL